MPNARVRLSIEGRKKITFLSQFKKPEITVSPRKKTSLGKVPGEDTAILKPLLPPFMQTKSKKHFPTAERFSEMSNELLDIDAASQTRLHSKTNIISARDKNACFTYARRNTENVLFCDETFDLENRYAEKVCVLSEDVCRGTDLKCEDSFESFAEIVEGESYGSSSEQTDSDYGEDEVGFTGEETGSRWRAKKEQFPWLLDRCETLSSISDVAEEEGQESYTTDPYLSHELYLPYRDTPKPRFFDAAGENVEYRSASLPRRPRSPIRRILPGKFDLKAAYKEWSTRQETRKTRNVLRESKDRISQSLKTFFGHTPDENMLISFVVLRAICEEIALMSMDVVVDVDIHNFVEIAVAWALLDLHFYHLVRLNDQQFKMLKSLGLLDFEMRSKFESDNGIGLRRELFDADRVSFPCSPNEFLHRRLPWQYVGPAHEKGHMKFYGNVMEEIDKQIPEAKELLKSAYVPDFTCIHRREIFDGDCVAYRRKSKLPFAPRKPTAGEFFVQLVSFM